MAAEPIRLLHFADVHLGLETYGRADPATGLSSRALDFIARLEEVRDYAAAEEADLVLFAGDAFRTRTPNPTYQREFARFVRDIAALCPVVLLVGSHDLPAGPGKAASIEIYDTLQVPNVIVGGSYAVHRVETRRGPVQVATAPYPDRAAFLPERRARRLTPHEADDLLRQAVEEKLRRLAEEVDADPAPRMLMGHFSVAGALAGSEKAIMLGRDAAIRPEALADPRWDYVALGHLHRHQAVAAGQPPIVYSGSIERLDFSEEGEPKGFCRVEVARGNAAWRFVEVAARPFLTIQADVRASRDPTAEVLRIVSGVDVAGAVVRVMIRLEEHNAALLRDGEIRRALIAAGADHVAALQQEVAHPLRSRLGQNPEQRTPEELLIRYFEQQEVPADRLELLLAAARELLAED